MTDVTIENCNATPNSISVNMNDSFTFINTYTTMITVTFPQQSPITPNRSFTVNGRVGGQNGTSTQTVTNNGANVRCGYNVTGTSCDRLNTQITGEIDVNPLK